MVALILDRAAVNRLKVKVSDASKSPPVIKHSAPQWIPNDR